MALTVKQIADRWTNDHLDLYNLALQLGDQEWQAQILQQLHNRNHSINKEAEQLFRESLWQRFDDTNRKILDLYASIKRSSSHSDQQKLREQAMELKLERVSVSNKIKEYGLNRQ